MVNLAEQFPTKNFGLFDFSGNLSLSHSGITEQLQSDIDISEFEILIFSTKDISHSEY